MKKYNKKQMDEEELSKHSCGFKKLDANAEGYTEEIGLTCRSFDVTYPVS